MRVVSWLVLIAVLSVPAVAVWDFTYFDFVKELPGGDKTGHVVLSCVLAFAAIGGVCGRSVRARGRHFGWCLATVAALVTLEELSQVPLPARSFSLADLAASYLGVGIAGVAAWSLAPRFAAMPTRPRGA